MSSYGCLTSELVATRTHLTATHTPLLNLSGPSLKVKSSFGSRSKSLLDVQCACAHYLPSRPDHVGIQLLLLLFPNMHSVRMLQDVRRGPGGSSSSSARNSYKWAKLCSTRSKAAFQTASLDRLLSNEVKNSLGKLSVCPAT